MKPPTFTHVDLLRDFWSPKTSSHDILFSMRIFHLFEKRLIVWKIFSPWNIILDRKSFSIVNLGFKNRKETECVLYRVLKQQRKVFYYHYQ